MAPGMRHISTSLFLLAAVLGVGCFQRPMTPPTTASLLTTAETLAEGEVAVGLNGGAQGAVFGPAVATAGGRLRYGATDDLELVVDGGAYVVSEDSIADEHRGIYTARFGLKYRLHEHFAAIGGLGAGIAPAFGFFGGIDGGLVAAYENPYVVPFVAGRVSFNGPVNPSEVDTGQPDNDEPGEVVAAPARTLGVSAETGVRIPFGPRIASGKRMGSLLGAFVLTHLYDGRGGLIEEADGITAIGGNFGIELVFD